jgi:hypothetical protein
MRVEIDVNDTFCADVSISDVCEAILAEMHSRYNTADNSEYIKRFIAEYYGLVSMIPDEAIRECMTETERDITSSAFKEQADRFDPRNEEV